VTGAPEARPGRRWRHALGLTALALAGAVLGGLPHALSAWTRGDATFLADTDQLLYTGWTRDVMLRGAWRLVDTLAGPSGPMMHPWALFVPLAQVARGLGVGLRGLPLVWRLVGGAGTALGLYAAVRPSLRDRRVALGVALLLLFDVGLIDGLPGYRAPGMIASLARHSDRYLEGTPRMVAHLRVVAPALVLPFLLLTEGLLVRARSTGSTRWAVAAGASLGLLFHLYFYFWTIVVGGLVLALVLDRKAWRVYATVLAVGLVLGLPAVVAGAQVKASTSPDWLHRTEKFVPVGHFHELLIPRVLLAIWLTSAFWVFRQRRDLTVLWCIVGAGLACTNHQVVTGLQIENFHWKIGTGTTFSVLLAALVAPWALERSGRDRASPRALAVLAALVVLQMTVGLALRGVESLRSRESVRLMADDDGLRADGIYPALPTGAVVAGEPEVVMIVAAVRDVAPLAGRFAEFASRVTDPEFDERLLLNLYLGGLPRAAARAAVEQPPGTLSWESLAVHSPEVAARQRARRRALVEQIWNDPARFAARYGVSHVVLPAATPEPWNALGAVGDVRLVVSGRRWRLWSIVPAQARITKKPRTDTGLE
jgi:hypothetical protein